MSHNFDLSVPDLASSSSTTPTSDPQAQHQTPCDVFHRLINLSSFGTDYEELKWEAARHALTLAFGKSNHGPALEEPTNVLKFLGYQIARQCTRRGTGERAGIEEVETVELKKSHEGAVRCAFAAFFNVENDPTPVLIPEHSRRRTPSWYLPIDQIRCTTFGFPKSGSPLLLLCRG